MSKSGWDEAKLFDILQLQNGYAFKPADLGETGTPVIRIKQLFDPLAEIDHSKKEIPERFRIDSGDVIFTWSARIDVAIWDRGEAYLNQHLFKVTSRDESRLLPEFVYMVILDLIPRLTSHGTTMKHVTKAELAKQLIYLPPIEEQREIVNFMQALDRMLQAGDRAISCAGQMRDDARQILLHEAEEQWGVASIADFTTFASGCSFPHSFQGNKFGEYPFFKVADMNTPANYPSMGVSANWINEDARTALKAKIHPEGTVIFPKVGAALKTEKRRILKRPSAFDNNIMGLIPTEDAHSFFIFIAMENVKLGPMSNPGPVPSVNQNTIRRVEIPAAPLEEQEKIVEKMQTLDTYIDSARRSQEALKQVRQGALHALLSGDKDVRYLAEMFATNEDVA